MRDSVKPTASTLLFGPEAPENLQMVDAACIAQEALAYHKKIQSDR